MKDHTEVFAKRAGDLDPMFKPTHLFGEGCPITDATPQTSRGQTNPAPSNILEVAISLEKEVAVTGELLTGLEKRLCSILTTLDNDQPIPEELPTGAPLRRILIVIRQMLHAANARLITLNARVDL